MELEIDKCRSITQIKHLSDAQLVAQIVKSHNAFNKKYPAKNSEVKKRLTKNDFKDKGRKDLWKEYLVFRAYKKDMIEGWNLRHQKPEEKSASKIKGIIFGLIWTVLFLGSLVCIVFLVISGFVMIFVPNDEGINGWSALNIFFLCIAIKIGIHFLGHFFAWLFGEEGPTSLLFFE